MRQKQAISWVKILVATAGVLLLSIVLWQRLGTSGRRRERPAAQETAPSSLLGETAMRSATAKAHVTHKTPGKPHKGSGGQMYSGDGDGSALAARGRFSDAG